MIIPIGWNSKRAIYAKVKDHDKVTASVKHDPLGTSSDQKTSNSKRLQLKDSKRGQFKVVRENNGYCVQNTLPIYLPFSKNFQRSVELRYWQVTTQFIKFEPVPIYLELSFILHTKFLLFFDGNTWSKNFQNTKTFLHLLKSVNNKHTFFEFMSSRKRTSASASRTVTLRKRNMAKHHGEDLRFEQDAVIHKKKIKENHQKSSLSWEPEKAT